MTEPQIFVSQDQPEMDPRISMTVEPVFEHGGQIAWFGSRIDPKWKFTDTQGHEFSDKNFRTDTHDTEYYCVDCGYEHGDSIYLCNQCDEEITPKYIRGDMCWGVYNPDRLLYFKTTITYVSDDGIESVYETNDHTIAQSILDNGCMTLEVAAKLEPYLKERTYSSW